MPQQGLNDPMLYTCLKNRIPYSALKMKYPRCVFVLHLSDCGAYKNSKWHNESLKLFKTSKSHEGAERPNNIGFEVLTF